MRRDHEEQDDDYDTVLPRRRNNLAIGGAGLFVGVGTLFNFFWSQIHENSLNITQAQIRIEGLAQRNERAESDIKELYARLALCKQ